jgi:hypothetical protein
MPDFEKLGVFYLGRPYDLQAHKPKEGWLLYDSKDLVTHAVCVGMTGSGKTGLCVNLIEEAALDGIPAIVIDPKGDLANLLLTFPRLRGEDFASWVNAEEAQKKGFSVAEYSQQQADLWKKGLAEWGQDGARIQRLRDAADFAIYTPGSRAGIPVSILSTFAAPPKTVMEDSEWLRERIGITATSLLGLVGIPADPLKSREHILIATILDTVWKLGQNLDLVTLIQHIQKPPFSRIGALDLEGFYPSKDRFELAVVLNNLLAAPGFDLWLQGEALDLGPILHTPEGKPRVAIFSIAHLGDAERMFFVSLLLNQTLGWMRTQSGTTSLRALLYMDEIFGFFPPVANPASKGPMLTLLKQARAFGLGIVLATQNPVDLDYKGLSNAGTWFLGRLQTERDKARVLEGLEGAAASSGAAFDKDKTGQILAGLGNRIFLLHNVHEDAPEVFESRWAMSYLRGPLTREQIKTLMDQRKQALPPGTAPETSVVVPEIAKPKGSVRPVLPPGVPECFIPVRGPQPQSSVLVYQPRVLGAVQVRFLDAKSKVDFSCDSVFTTPVTDETVPVAWEKGDEAPVALSDLEKSPREGAQFADLPSLAGRAKSYEGWSKDFSAWVYGNRKTDIFRSPGLQAFSNPGETERDFRIRLQQVSREQRDRMTEALRQKYAPKKAALEERLRRAQQTVDREAEQAKQQKMQAAISVGATLLGAFMGRKALKSATLGRATTAARGVSRSLKESQDIGRAEETVESVKKQMADLDAQFQAEIEALSAKTDPLTETLETVTLRPKKSDISVRLVALAWAPCWMDPQGRTLLAWR